MADEFDINLRIAEAEATKLIEKYGINAPEHIRLEDIAFDLGAFVTEGALERAAASLVKTKQLSVIRVQSIDSLERKRFSIAHELGHLVLGHILSFKKICTQEDMMNWYDNNLEAQANFFAGELLLPKKLIEKRCDVCEVNFSSIKAIAKEFMTSLTATAIRFVRFCPESCALVFSSDCRIKWFYTSSTWWAYIRKGQKLDNRSLAYDFFQGKTISKNPEEIEANAWCDSRNVHEITEHSIGSKHHNFVLSILWMKG